MLSCRFGGVFGIPKFREEGVGLSWGRGDNVVEKEDGLLVVILGGNCDLWSCGGMWRLPSFCTTTGGEEEGKDVKKLPVGVEVMWRGEALVEGKVGNAVVGGMVVEGKVKRNCCGNFRKEPPRVCSWGRETEELRLGRSRKGAGVTGGRKMGIIAFGELKSKKLKEPLFEGLVSPLTKLKLLTGGLKLEESLAGDSKMGINVTG